jgi:holliday junction DNA helicase RuvA
VIALLQGTVAVRRSDHVVVLCDGVGYRAAVSAETLRHVPAVGEQVTLHTHLIVRDDALALYGFHGEPERDLFLMLLSVQAVGPKVALAVLSAGRPRELVAALATGDAARFQAVPGIGKRTAERIIVELREKVAGEDWAGAEEADDGSEDGDVVGAAPHPGRSPIVARRGEQPHPRTLAREGLIELGYGPGEAEELLRDLDDESAEELIAGALRLARSAG